MFQNGLKNKDIDLLKVYKQKKEASPYVGTLKYLVFPIRTMHWTLILQQQKQN